MADELHKLEQLEEKLATLEFESYDQDTIVQKVVPLFDVMLLRRLESKDEKTLGIFAEHIAHILSRASVQNPETLTEALKKTISQSIGIEIVNNKEHMIDALYPILGGMISKYVVEAIKELIETLNKKIDDGLSFERYKRKIRSKLTGVSETELMLQESGDAQVTSLLVIHKNSGLLIAEAHTEKKSFSDTHMIASMASAIKDFINDWIENNHTQSEVQILSYGNATLYIESAGSVYVIAFLDTVPKQVLRSQINTFFGTLLKSHSKTFQTFEGDDDSSEIEGLTAKMQRFLDAQTKLTKVMPYQSNMMTYVGWSVVAVAALFAGYLLYQTYRSYVVEKEINSKIGYAVDVKHYYNRVEIGGYIESIDDASRIKAIVKAHTKAPMVDQLIVRTDALVHTKQALEKQDRDAAQQKVELDEKIVQIERSLVSLQADFDRNKERMKKILNLKENIIKKLNAGYADGGIFDPLSGFLDFGGKKLFEAGSAELTEASKPLVNRTFDVYFSVLLKDEHIRPYVSSILIEGHTDTSGDDAKNAQLSLQRAKEIQAYLLKRYADKMPELEKIISAKGMGNAQPVMLHDGSENKEASRRIKVKWQIDTVLMLERLKEIVR